MSAPFNHLLTTNEAPSSEDVHNLKSYLSYPKNRIIEIRRRIGALHIELAALNAERDTMAERYLIPQHEAILSPVRRLPTSVLQTIFVYGVLTAESIIETHSVIIILSRVCRRWRTVVLQTRSLHATALSISTRHNNVSRACPGAVNKHCAACSLPRVQPADVIYSMSESSNATIPKNPSQFPSKPAWSNGPPPSSRSQSPASSTSTHSRGPGVLGQGASIKDGIGILRNAGSAKEGSAVSYGFSDDVNTPISSSPAPTTNPPTKSEGVKSFDSVPAAVSDNGKSAVQTSAKPASVAKIGKLKVDIAKLFQDSSSASTSAPSQPSSPNLRPAVAAQPPSSQTYIALSSDGSCSSPSLAEVTLVPVVPLKPTANRWDRKALAVDPNSPEIVDRKVKGLLNKLTMQKFDSISDQIIAWANKSENEKDGRTLIQVIRLVFEKATDEAAWSEMYARLCRKMMEQISNRVQDDGIKGEGGAPITGGHLFRKYLLNRCQEDFERGWVAKETTAAAAAGKAGQDEAIKAGNENKEGEEIALYSDEYYAAQKAKRQGLGLIKFIGELFKLQMLTERIMHECVKKLLGNVDNPEEEEIESLCKLLATVGEMLDTQKARPHMDVYFSRMKELRKSSIVCPRLQFMLQDVIELRERHWVPRHPVEVPMTIAQIREAAAREYSHLEYNQREKLRWQLRSSSFSDSESDVDASSESSDGEAEVETMRKIAQYSMEFFVTRDLEEAETYFKLLPATRHYLLVDDLVHSTIESDAWLSQQNARLVGDLFARASSKGLCSPTAIEEGIAPTVEFLDDITTDTPSALDLLAIMMQRAKLSDVRRERIASKSENHCAKLLELSKPHRLPSSFRRDTSMTLSFDVGQTKSDARFAHSSPREMMSCRTGAPRAPPKAGHLSKFGQINKGSNAPLTFGPQSNIYSGKKDKRESIQRTNSQNMFSMLQNSETPAEPSAPKEPTQRKKLVLAPRFKPGESITADARKKIEEDLKEFFAFRNLDEAEDYFKSLSALHHHLLVDKLVSYAIESKAADAQLVAAFFARASSKSLCASTAFEEGIAPVAEFLDDIAIDAPKAPRLLAIIINGANLSKEQRRRIASKSEESGAKLLELVS